MAKYPQPILVVKVVYSSPSRQMTNPSYWTLDEPPTTQAAMNQISTAADAVFGPLMKNVMPDTCTYDGVTCLYLNGGNQFFGSSEVSAGTGSIGGPPLPDQNAVVLAKETGKYGRQYLGRYFIGCVPQDVVSLTDTNQVVADVDIRGRYYALASAYGADQSFGSHAGHARHWDRKSNTLVPVTKVYLRSKFASQRKRRRHEPDNLLSNS